MSHRGLCSATSAFVLLWMVSSTSAQPVSQTPVTDPPPVAPTGPPTGTPGPTVPDGPVVTTTAPDAQRNKGIPPIVVDGNMQCSGFSLLTPLFGVSNRDPSPTNPNKRDGLRVTGPVETGIGGGYYHSLTKNTCSGNGTPDTKLDDWIVAWEIFAFSEGLNPATTFQIGIGGGLSLTVLGKFQLGIGLGYDLIRRETIERGGVSRTYSNGLLIGNDIIGCGGGYGGDNGASGASCAGRNFTWLLTFGITDNAGQSSTPEPPKPPSEDNADDDGVGQ